MEASASSPPEGPDESVGLCETCQEAHFAALHQADDPLHPAPRKATGFSPSLPDDEWPSLPRLLRSMEGGCAFCGFLRESILSEEFKDACEQSFEGRLSHTDRKTITLRLSYGETRTEYDHLDQFRVMVTFKALSTVVLRFHIEAIPGKQLRLRAQAL